MFFNFFLCVSFLPKVCCNGVLHDHQPSYECCDTNYLPARSDPSDVCCGGRFTPSQSNHECCQGQYVQVLPGQICCPDPGENRVAVGVGDVCCGGVPFENSGPQICCAGKSSPMSTSCQLVKRNILLFI